GRKLDVRSQLFFDPLVILLAIESVGNRGAANDGTSEAGLLDDLEFVGVEQLDGLVTDLGSIASELVQWNFAIAPAADRLFDITFGLSRLVRMMMRYGYCAGSKRLQHGTPIPDIAAHRDFSGCFDCGPHGNRGEIDSQLSGFNLVISSALPSTLDIPSR